MSGVAFAATEDDVKVELAKILHKPPFPLEPVLNFDVFLFKNFNSRGKMGILTLPSESAGHTFLRSYGTTGVAIKGPRVLFRLSNRPLNQDKVAILNAGSWRDPQQLQAERDRRIHEGRPHLLSSYAFGRFLADGSFSAELVVQGLADIACDLERRQVRFTLRKQGHATESANDSFITSMLSLMTLGPSEEPAATIVSYPPPAVDAVISSKEGEEPTLFIRANTFPQFAIEVPNPLNERSEPPRRAQGLISDVPMSPGCFSLMCTFTDMDERDAFIHAARYRFHLRCSNKQSAIHVRNNTSTQGNTSQTVDFLKDLPFELAFEVEKAITNWTLSTRDVASLKPNLEELCNTYGDAAAPIFRQFITLLEDEGRERQRGRGRRARDRRLASTTLEGRLTHATELYLEEQARPRGRLAPALINPAITYSYHMILTPTRHILEGPVADQSNSVLRRFKRHECFLRVSFQDENRSKLRRDLETSITDLLRKRYRPILLDGCFVAGRRYHMLGYSMSGLKEHSLWFVTPFRDENGRVLNAQLIRESLVGVLCMNSFRFDDQFRRETFRACFTNPPGSGLVGLKLSRRPTHRLP